MIFSCILYYKLFQNEPFVFFEMSIFTVLGTHLDIYVLLDFGISRLSHCPLPEHLLQQLPSVKISFIYTRDTVHWAGLRKPILFVSELQRWLHFWYYIYSSAYFTL